MAYRRRYVYNPFTDKRDSVEEQPSGATGPTGAGGTGPTGPTSAGITGPTGSTSTITGPTGAENAFTPTGTLPVTGPDARDGRALYWTATGQFNGKHAYLYQA